MSSSEVRLKSKYESSEAQYQSLSDYLSERLLAHKQNDLIVSIIIFFITYA